MKTYLAAAAIAAALAQPAAAVTFPTLTTIYVGAGVRDNGGADDSGLATSFICSNVSGVTTSIRFLVLDNIGAVIASSTSGTVVHGQTITVSTHSTTTFIETSLATGGRAQGVINIESTQSAVFCTAAIIHAATEGQGIPLHLVRVNPHPGTVE